MLYHCYFPCTCLPAVSLKFVNLLLLNPLLGALPPLLGHDNKRFVCYPPQVSPAAMEYTRTVLFPGGFRRLSNQYAENRDISPSTGNLLLDSELPTGIQSSSGGAHFVELALLYKLCPATVGLKAGVKKQRKSNCMQYCNYSNKSRTLL